MVQLIAGLSPIAIIVVTLIGFLLGGLWYSPLLFVKPWMREMKITKESAKAANAGKGPMMFGGAILFTLVSTIALAALLSARHIISPVKGAEFGFFVGVALVGAREATNALFESRTLKHFLIVAGHDVVLLTVQGAILAAWR